MEKLLERIGELSTEYRKPKETIDKDMIFLLSCIKNHKKDDFEVRYRNNLISVLEWQQSFDDDVWNGLKLSELGEEYLERGWIGIERQSPTHQEVKDKKDREANMWGTIIASLISKMIDLFIRR